MKNANGMDVVSGDLRAKFTPQSEGSGFASVELYDADDHESFSIGEDAAVALYKWLGEKLKADGLIYLNSKGTE